MTEQWYCSKCDEVHNDGETCAAEDRQLDRLVIPPEMLDLVRFMCATWTDIDKWAYEYAGGDALMKYPVIQGTRNQINLHRIGEQDYDNANIHKAVKWLLDEAV